MQNLADQIDSLTEIVFLDDGVRPDGAHQAVFLDEVALFGDKDDQGIEGAGRQVQAPVSVQERTLGRDQAEGPKLIRGLAGHIHGIQKNSEKNENS